MRLPLPHKGRVVRVISLVQGVYKQNMASTRKSQRPNAGRFGSQSPALKRSRVETSVQPSSSASSPIANVDVEGDDEYDIGVDECEQVEVDISTGEVMEEVVVTMEDPNIGNPDLDPGNEEIVGDGDQPEIVATGRPVTNTFVFKDPNFIHSSKGPGGSKKTRIWKNLKQIVAAERTMAWGPDDVTYGSIDAPPSFKPAKKYSDISGLEAPYTDPQTKMRFANADEYRRVRMLPGDIISGCLQLRKAKTLVP